MLQEKTRLSVSCPGDPNSSTIARCAISKPNNKFPIFQDQRKARPEQFRADGNRSSTQRMTVGGTQPRKESVVEGRWPSRFANTAMAISFQPLPVCTSCWAMEKWLRGKFGKQQPLPATTSWKI